MLSTLPTSSKRKKYVKSTIYFHTTRFVLLFYEFPLQTFNDQIHFKKCCFFIQSKVFKRLKDALTMFSKLPYLDKYIFFNLKCNFLGNQGKIDIIDDVLGNKRRPST